MNTPITPPPLTIQVTPKPRPPSVVQGIYWIITGIWPVLHRASFEWVTGPKVDFWLVELIGLLLALMGAVMFIAHLNDRVTVEIAGMSLGGAAAVVVISVIYVARERISPMYLADVVLELMIIAAWIRWLVARPQHRMVPLPPDALPPAAPRRA